jgi:hypothetical protein
MLNVKCPSITKRINDRSGVVDQGHCSLPLVHQKSDPPSKAAKSVSFTFRTVQKVSDTLRERLAECYIDTWFAAVKPVVAVATGNIGNDKVTAVMKSLSSIALQLD